ncbi:MAG: phosphonate ABC transporter, permease protein PhnE [Geobacter sp.]|uniref:phosphonate ABC transporter, permease protein PhnE n=1 Tax=Trichlorobacter lovleyi TaxID=313985 RepID=UPI0023F49E89|nr:phosphonate ABC transporter, permease protein PhnE [Trichlorobacter lovleyi]
MPQEYTDILVEQQRRWRKTLALTAGIVTLVIGFSFYTGLFDPQRLSEGIPSVISLMAEGSPPDFSTAGTWLKPLFDTLAMSIAGTAIAVFFSVPLGLLAARNTTPHPIVYQMARTILNGLRSVPELIMGILFVAAVGFGALPGVLALGLHSIGMVGKFISEAIEHVADEPLEATRSAGATPLQVITHGVLPQVFPQISDVTIYRWEYNFRASTVMGMVGAGGIGFELMGSLRLMQYQEVSAILLVILGAVTMVDAIGIHLRKRFK